MGITTESKRGSNCSGTDGTASRTLTLANTSLTESGGFTIYVNGLALVPTTEYSVSHLSASSVITFVNVVFNTDYIVVIYIQGGSGTLSAKYCTYTDVYNKTGLSTTEVSSTIVDALIVDAESEIETLTGRVFTNANSITEYFSIKDKDLIGNYQTSIQLSHWPVQSITEFKQLDTDGSVVDTYDTFSSAEIAANTLVNDDCYLTVLNDPLTNTSLPNGRIVMISDTFPKGTNNVKVSYTYGYSSVPQIIKDLDTCLTGVRVWMAFIGGCYNRLNSYSIPQQSVNKGDFYQRAQMNIQLLTDEANRILDRVGRKQRTLFFATGGDR